MYETEANHKIESPGQLPPEVLSAFGELKGKVLARTVLPWSEHCTECVWPTCYTTCDLYEPRADLRCRRFVDGMVRINCAESPNSYLLKIRFKRWGKLWTPGNVRLSQIERAAKLEQRDYRVGKLLYQLPLPPSLKRVATGKRYSFKKRVAQRPAYESQLPDSFLLECYNPQDEAVRLSFTIRAVGGDAKVPFQTLIDLKPGFNRARIPVEDVSRVLDLRSPFTVDMIPNNVSDGTTLYFGIMDFVCEAQATTEAKKIKCVVWDLDNTLWDGILVEDGPDNLRLKPGIPGIITELDRRGILHSIASKNNAQEALGVLKRLGLDEYFLAPQISWGPKSEGIKAIARALNLSVDAFLFVDDSEFELQQVQAACTGIRTLVAHKYKTLLEMEECDVPVTAEAASRRKLYQVEAERSTVAQSFGQDYMAFLKHCDIRLNLQPLTPENLDRVHELTQRTNQMNFSGNRYTREVLRRILSTPQLDTYVIDCEDRFGSYGVVGFALVDSREPRLTDLMFSCRIQSKRVEHAVVAFLIRKYAAECGKDFLANYRRTPRNAPSGQVFEDLGMHETGISDGVSSLMFPAHKTPPDDAIVQIRVQEDALVAG